MGRKLLSLENHSFDHASPMTLTSLRWMIAIVCLLPMVWFKEKKIIPPRAAILPLILMGISGVALFNIFQFFSIRKNIRNKCRAYFYIKRNFNRIIFCLISKRKSKYTSNFIYDSFILRGDPRPIKR